MRLEIKNVSKWYYDKEIYKHISFSFRPGCYAIVGPNGSGKTVLLELLAGILPPDTGEIIFSQEKHQVCRSYKQYMTFIPSKPAFFPRATGQEFLSFIAGVKKIFDRKQLSSWIEALNLAPYLPLSFAEMSLGTQKKLFLATLALGRNQLIIMDEPTNALDEDSAQALSKKIMELSRDTIIILATHDQKLLSAIRPILISIPRHPITHFTTG